MSDLVKRLRTEPFMWFLPLVHEAADRIEELEDEIRRLKAETSWRDQED